MYVRDYDSVYDYQVQRFRSWGGELSYSQLLFKQVGVFGSYVYQHVRDRTPYGILDSFGALNSVKDTIPVLQVPNRARFGITWHSPSGISLNLIHTYIGPKFGSLGNSGNKINGYFLGDINLSYESPRTRSYLATIGVNNIYGAAFRQSLRQRDPGVTFYGNIELRGVLPISKYFWSIKNSACRFIISFFCAALVKCHNKTPRNDGRRRG